MKMYRCEDCDKEGPDGVVSMVCVGVGVYINLCHVCEILRLADVMEKHRVRYLKARAVDPSE